MAVPHCNAGTAAAAETADEKKAGVVKNNNNNFLGSIFQAISDVINGAERAFLDFLSALVPYFVPVIPAYLTFFHTTGMMGFPREVAWTAAFVVEVLGMTSVSTAIRFWRNNQRYTDRNRKAPFWLAVATYVFYLVVVLAVNVILEVKAATRSSEVIWAIALFSMLSVPSGVLISIRSQFREMLDEWQIKRAPQNERASVTQMEVREVKLKHASDYRDKILAMLDAEYAKSGNVLPPREITARLKIEHNNNKGFVSNLTKQWKASKGIGSENVL